MKLLPVILIYSIHSFAQLDPAFVVHNSLVFPVAQHDSMAFGRDTGTTFQAYANQSFIWLPDKSVEFSKVWQNGNPQYEFNGKFTPSLTVVRDSFYNGSMATLETRIYKNSLGLPDSVVNSNLNGNWDNYAIAYDYDSLGILTRFRLYSEEFGGLFKRSIVTVHSTGSRIDSVVSRSQAQNVIGKGIYYYNANRLDSIYYYVQTMPGQVLVLYQKTFFHWSNTEVKEIVHFYALNNGKWRVYDVWRYFLKGSAISLDEEMAKFTLYPNPAKNYIHLDMELKEDAQLYFIDETGRQILTKTFSPFTDVSSWPEGYYRLYIKNNQGLKSIPFLISR